MARLIRSARRGVRSSPICSPGSGRYADPETAALADFNPMNLIMVADGHARFLTNRPESERSKLEPGIYGLSNGRLDEPWPKTLHLKSLLLQWIVGEAEQPAQLFDALREEKLPDSGLRPTMPSEVPQEPALSSIFIRDPVYGTRCSTVVAVDAQGAGVIIERRFTAEAKPAGETRFSFTWPG